MNKSTTTRTRRKRNIINNGHNVYPIILASPSCHFIPSPPPLHSSAYARKLQISSIYFAIFYYFCQFFNWKHNNKAPAESVSATRQHGACTLFNKLFTQAIIKSNTKDFPSRILKLNAKITLSAGTLITIILLIKVLNKINGVRIFLTINLTSLNT